MSFWKDKKVLITGIVGSNLTKGLLAKGAHIVSYQHRDVLPSSLLVLENLDCQIAKKEMGAIEDFDRLNSVVRDHQVEVIFHLAAQPLVGIGQQNPISTLDVNIRGTWNILEAARQNNV